ncbi:hypothetical protein AU210_016448 [Fusarium oxysporum f. sp. radicis-cucumerinum]|uniref:Uncharacterized protein n=1 Tax=Fusarium oxysporum f. sp. radicis-cucumerinum TaxID=327505 RepID=A0A2H3FS18_FUSOX|nr:hypothetical protein AU210_016448 [Fusarium oxysporum f. sp. radicis-cucumerinum]
MIRRSVFFARSKTNGERGSGNEELKYQPLPWPDTKHWLHGTLLPLHGLDLVDTHKSVEKTGTLNGSPACYKYDSSSKSFSWARGYEDDGAKRSERYFAFVLLNGGKLCEQSYAAWIPVEDIQGSDANKAAIVEHTQIALVTERLDQLESERVAVMKEKEGFDANRMLLAITCQFVKPGWQVGLDKCDETWWARVLKLTF